MKKSMN